MLNTLKQHIEELTGLEVVCKQLENEAPQNCIVIKLEIQEEDDIKAMARAEIYVIHEMEEKAKYYSSEIKKLILNVGDYNKIPKLKVCKIVGSNPHCFIYKDKYHDMKTYSLIYRV